MVLGAVGAVQSLSEPCPELILTIGPGVVTSIVETTSDKKGLVNAGRRRDIDYM